jgi:DNA-binding NarL/FixJ family response regulator
MAINVLITDDHKVVRQGLKMVLDLDPELEVGGEAENGEEAARLALRPPRPGRRTFTARSCSFAKGSTTVS